jgi:ferredoxin-type protein NapF
MPAPASISRRQFLTGSAGHVERSRFAARPPGVTAQSVSACTRCGKCADACPENILLIGKSGVELAPQAGECTFCGACAEACPEPVFHIPLEMAHSVRIGEGCLAKAGIACMTCRDVCPESAIRMEPRMGGPFLPRLDAEACTSCGACIGPCPADAIEAFEISDEKEEVHV